MHKRSGSLSGKLDHASVVSYIEALDLRKYHQKIQQLYPNHDWSESIFEQAVVDYKRFLELKHLYPNEHVAPTKLIDDIWHMHILDTKKYHFDCDRIFGTYLHHTPGFSNDISEKSLQAKKNLHLLFLERFKQKPTETHMSIE